MKKQTDRRSSTTSIGPRFTDNERDMMRVAMKESAIYMQHYGKGYTPTTIGVDRRNYIGAPQPIDTI